MKYVVNFAVNARMRVEVEADSPEDAIDKANDIMSDADCGPLHDIDWKARNVEDESGNIVKEEEC